MVLYLFITHKKNLDKSLERISKMMSSDYVVACGGSIKDNYDEDLKLINLNCNDGYAGLPEKVMKSFHFIVSDPRFEKYTHIAKLDDDMVVSKKIENIDGDYIGNVHYGDGNRQWHIGRCGNFWDRIPYLGEFKPWCMGGFGYIVSRSSLEKICPNFNYLDHIYEDVYIGLLMNRIGVIPKKINTRDYFVSPDH